MTKDELLAEISEGIRTEETASALYLKHLNAIVTRSGLADESNAEAGRIISSLIESNKRHKSILEKLREEVRGEDIDVY